MIISTIFIILPLIISILCIVSLWKLYTKAGKPGWASIVPIYNLVVLNEIADIEAWWVILELILPPSMIYADIKLAKAFGQNAGFGIGLFFLPPIFFPILAFGKDKPYIGKAPTPADLGIPPMPVSPAQGFPAADTPAQPFTPAQPLAPAQPFAPSAEAAPAPAEPIAQAEPVAAAEPVAPAAEPFTPAEPVAAAPVEPAAPTTETVAPAAEVNAPEANTPNGNSENPTF